jgi:ubiquinol-cytochrome c reductase cytochrome c1 subunit
MNARSGLLIAAFLVATPALAQTPPASPPAAVPAADADVMPALPKVPWSFDGPFGTFDRAALQRGFQIYNEVCSNCHSMNLLSYRDLSALGYSEDQIKAIAAQKEVTDGPNDQGEMFQRPALPADHFVAPFANEKAARAANNGALPPDLSVIIKARDGGADYVHGILTGFTAPPAGFPMSDNMQYDLYFPGYQIAMPPPLADNTVSFADGTQPLLDEEARDVTTFLTWASEPTMEERKRTGAKVVIFLLAMTGVLYGAKRRVWSKLH